MSRIDRALPRTALTGWRAQWWAVVLFMALLRGLVPHVVLADAVMQPGGGWCSAGSSALSAIDLGQGSSAMDHGCVCAASADGGASAKCVVEVSATLAMSSLSAKPRLVQVRAGARLPPAIGPPGIQ